MASSRLSPAWSRPRRAGLSPGPSTFAHESVAIFDSFARPYRKSPFIVTPSELGGSRLRKLDEAKRKGASGATHVGTGASVDLDRLAFFDE